MLQEFNFKKLRHCRNAKLSPRPGNLWLRLALPQPGTLPARCWRGAVPLGNAWLQPSIERKPAIPYPRGLRVIPLVSCPPPAQRPGHPTSQGRGMRMAGGVVQKDAVHFPAANPDSNRSLGNIRCLNGGRRKFTSHRG